MRAGSRGIGRGRGGSRGRACLHGDEAGGAAHELHEADAVVGGGGLDLGGHERALRLLHRGVKAEASVHLHTHTVRQAELALRQVVLVAAASICRKVARCVVWDHRAAPCAQMLTDLIRSTEQVDIAVFEPRTSQRRPGTASLVQSVLSADIADCDRGAHVCDAVNHWGPCGGRPLSSTPQQAISAASVRVRIWVAQMSCEMGAHEGSQHSTAHMRVTETLTCRHRRRPADDVMAERAQSEAVSAVSGELWERRPYRESSGLQGVGSERAC